MLSFTPTKRGVEKVVAILKEGGGAGGTTSFGVDFTW